MDFSGILLSIGEVIAALGGIGIVAGAAGAAVSKHLSSRWIETHKSTLSREVETHKSTLGQEADRHRLLLKRQELMFEREVSAAESFSRIYETILDLPNNPYADWDSAQITLIENSATYRDDLSKFIANHSVAVSAQALSKIKSARRMANDLTFMLGEETQGEDYGIHRQPSDTARKSADEFWEEIDAAQKQIRDDLKGGSLASARSDAAQTVQT